MENFTDWEVPVKQGLGPLDGYLNYDHEIDDLFNETLLGLQDLDVPTGFVNDLNQKNQNSPSHQIHHGASNSFSFKESAKRHSRKISGSAIFGFDNHTRQLSLEFAPDLYKDENKDDKSISPSQIHNLASNPTPQSNPQASRQKTQAPLRRSPLRSEHIEEKTINDEEDDLIVTNATPKSYKFPPSPRLKDQQQEPSAVTYSAKYLQELGRINSTAKRETYTDDIEPLLEQQPSQDNQNSPKRQKHNGVQAQQVSYDMNKKYVPIPVQDPTPIIHKNSIYKQTPNYHLPHLPPPSPPSIHSCATAQPSSEPRSYQSASPRHLNSSPINENLFYNPQFFSDGRQHLYDDGGSYSSQFDSGLSSSPTKSFYTPHKNAPTNDDSIDANATITQLTPLKNSTYPITPLKNNMVLEWSPIVSPDAKSSRDVKLAIKQSSPRRRIKKTSLLPPGELDRYWDGPDAEKFFTCHYKGCGKKFTRRYNVRSHIQTHLSDRPFGCSYCPKRFVRQHDLNRHIKGHLEAQHCRCECGKEFTRVDAMKKHKLRNVCSGGIVLNSREYELDDQDQRTEDGLTRNLLDDLKHEMLNDSVL